MVKIDTLFLTKMAKIPYPLAPHIPISPHPPAPLWALNPTVNGHCLQMHSHSRWSPTNVCMSRKLVVSIQSRFNIGLFDTNSSSEIEQKFWSLQVKFEIEQENFFG